MQTEPFPNPYRAGAGLPPPHLAGREKQTHIFSTLLQQEKVSRNLILTGLRGTGKTVLLDSWKPVAISNRWIWAGADLSESASVSEATMAIRILTDLSIVTAQLLKGKKEKVGFTSEAEPTSLDYSTLLDYYGKQPGLVSDKLRNTLEFVWAHIKNAPNIRGIVFAYDE
ncbi:MAG TPA: ATP-binding protein, partial [Candidatus Paceibacterota bacterium]|nr:ATP-binding protein [Candidatus Paceibacterota bacterium]